MALCVATVIAACSWMSEPDLTGQLSGNRDAATLRASSSQGPLAQSATQNTARRANDDEFAVDAREVTRKPGTGTAPYSTQSGSVAASAGLRAAIPQLPRSGSGASSPPKLNVLYVSNGRIRAYGPNIWIRGTVEDDRDGVEVTVNGQKAQVKDKSFQRRIAVPPGESDVTVRAEDIDGNVTTSRFVLTRTVAGSSLPAARAPAEIAAPEYTLPPPPNLDRVPKIEDVREAGVYMVLMAGTPSAHFVKMPNLAQCREAVEYTENAACTFHKGRD